MEEFGVCPCSPKPAITAYSTPAQLMRRRFDWPMRLSMLHPDSAMVAPGGLAASGLGRLVISLPVSLGQYSEVTFFRDWNRHHAGSELRAVIVGGEMIE